MNGEQIAKEAVAALEAKQGDDIRLYDVRGISSITDYTVVATGTSAPHLKALISETQRHMKELGVASYRLSGDPASGWVIVDYITAVIHVFSAEARAYYAIERLWTQEQNPDNGTEAE